MSKHTPGPWIPEIEPTNTEGVNVRFSVNSKEKLHICSGQSQEHLGEDHGIHEDESRANARLIAAAPELLEALKLSLITARPGPTSVDWQLAVEDIREQARAAIAKAEGSGA